ncbi:MAG: hypothetical protein BAJATHORv1_20009 [Candidatus Thorarchaeota archaeon]|nr:MAG: hypothetical protein BAJATHORv1_20009 [Candidatus Thorarchaeota archaeon]
MLKEVYLIEDGMLIYHYNINAEDDDSDQAVLSSGLMSAIRDFSEQTRADALQSFSTESEFFQFIPCHRGQAVLVGVFERRTSEQLAQQMLTKVREVLKDAKMPETDGAVMKIEERNRISASIVKLANQFFGSEGVKEYIESILSERTDIPLAFVVDTEKKKAIAHFARPKPLFKAEQVQELLLAHSTILRALTKLEIMNTYDYVVMQSEDYATSICHSGKILGVTTGAIRVSLEDVIKVGAEICYLDEIDSFHDKIEKAQIERRAQLNKEGKISHIEGEEFPPIAPVFFSTVLNNIEGLFRTLTRRNFQTCLIVRWEKDLRGIRFRKYPEENFTEIEILS